MYAIRSYYDGNACAAENDIAIADLACSHDRHHLFQCIFHYLLSPEWCLASIQAGGVTRCLVGGNQIKLFPADQLEEPLVVFHAMHEFFHVLFVELVVFGKAGSYNFV